jgi:putative protease
LPAERITQPILETYGQKLIAQLPTLLFPIDEAAFGERLKRLADSGLRAVWANNIYGIALGKKLGLTVHGGFGLNVVNAQALQLYAEQELSSLTVSFELAMAKVLALGGAVPRGIVSYGRLPLMHVRNCPVQADVGCAACGGKGELIDRKQVIFPVECGEKRFSTLLNSVVLDIAGKEIAGLDHQLLYFTRESPEEIAVIAKRFQLGQCPDAPHTNGLYYRQLL